MIRSRSIVLVGCLWAAGSAVGACGGQSLSLGTSTVTQAIDPGLLVQPAGACQPGYAHPNVCCTETASGAAQCEVYPNAPFFACPADYDTLPNPTSCCPLDPSAGECIDQDAGSSPPPQDSGSSQCVYACPLGWYPPAAASGAAAGASAGASSDTTASASSSSAVPAGCCTTDATGQATCVYPADACPAMPQPVCACPAILVEADGATSGPACTCGVPSSSACTLPPAPPKPICGPCPSGWQAPDGEPGLCCQTESDGVIECFSQAVPPPPPAAVDAGSSPPETVDGSSPPGRVDGSPPPAQDASAPEDASAQDAAGGECVTASDCKGALPALCMVCKDGGDGCAHFECVDDECEIAYCE